MGGLSIVLSILIIIGIIVWKILECKMIAEQILEDIKKEEEAIIEKSSKTEP